MFICIDVDPLVEICNQEGTNMCFMLPVIVQD
jgi:hypothetical protein